MVIYTRRGSWKAKFRLIHRTSALAGKRGVKVLQLTPFLVPTPTTYYAVVASKLTGSLVSP